MELYLQCGNGFMSLAKQLNDALRGTTYILSPRDLSENSQISFAKQIEKSGCHVLLDPQLYAPRSDKSNFQTYGYWPKDCQTGDGGAILNLIDQLGELNVIMGARGYILPAYRINHIPRNVDDKSVQLLRIVAEKARKFNMPLYTTLCLEQNVLLDEVQVDRLIGFAEGWSSDGVYLVAEHPDSDYFVDNPIWMFQLMRLCAALRLQGKRVILGYANHQMLCMVCTGIEAIATGNWMNTRSFTIDKFKSDTGDIKRHKLWYYAPSTLTEYSIPYLDVAYTRKVLQYIDCRMLVPDSPAAKIVSGNVRPSSIDFRQPDSFVHYLLALNKQLAMADADGTYQGRYKHQLEMLESAGKRLALMAKYRINGQNRDFGDMIKVNETALNMFNTELGMRMSMLQ